MKRKPTKRNHREMTIKDLAQIGAEIGMRLKIGAEPNDEPMPLRSMMWKPDEYEGLDVGILFAVKVLHAAGIETCQSCQGGEGHAYREPSVDLSADASGVGGFAALAALRDYGLPVNAVSIVWDIMDGLPYSKLWRITFSRTMEDRANDSPMFEWSYRHRAASDIGGDDAAS